MEHLIVRYALSAPKGRAQERIRHGWASPPWSKRSRSCSWKHSLLRTCRRAVS